jgi:altronate dehydratase
VSVLVLVVEVVVQGAETVLAEVREVQGAETVLAEVRE